MACVLHLFLVLYLPASYHTAQKLSKYPVSDSRQRQKNCLSSHYIFQLIKMMFVYFRHTKQKIVVSRNRSIWIYCSVYIIWVHKKKIKNKTILFRCSTILHVWQQRYFDCYLGNIHTKYFMYWRWLGYTRLQTVETYVMDIYINNWKWSHFSEAVDFETISSALTTLWS